MAIHPRAFSARLRSLYGRRGIEEGGPIERETGIDKVKFRLRGRWRQLRCDQSEQLVAHARLCELLTAQSRSDRIFQTQTAQADYFHTKSLKNVTGTVGKLDLTGRLNTGGNVGLTIEVNINPSRTLAHLVAEGFNDIQGMEELDAASFFTPGAPQRSLDGADNYVTGWADVQHGIGGNPYGGFLLTFERKLQDWLVRLFVSEDGCERSDTDTHIIATTPEAEVALDWSTISLTKAEVFFERNTREAVRYVRSMRDAGVEGIAGAISRNYGGRHEVRSADWTIDGNAPTLVVPVARERELSVYAKAADVVRFEWRFKRTGLSRLIEASHDCGTQRLSGSLERLRLHSIEAFPWGQLRALHDQPTFPDVRVVSRALAVLAEQCRATNRDLGAVVEVILNNGSITETEETGLFPRGLLERLRRRGLLRRIMVSPRGRRGQPRRYALASELLTIREGLLSALQRGTEEQADEPS